MPRKCYACRKPFTVRIGSIFEDSHLPLHLWLQVIHLMSASKKGISTRQIQRMLQCSMKTAWFLTHRIREAMAERGLVLPPLGGSGMTVEADETYIGAKAGRKLRRPVTEKQVVFSLVERNGKVRSFHLTNVRASTVRNVLSSHTRRQSVLMTDESAIYMGVGWNFARHDYVNHSEKEYVRGDVYTNTVEGYFSILKRGLYGIFQHVSEHHLHRYLSEFDFRYSNRAAVGVDDIDRTALIVQGGRNKRLTYQTTAAGAAA
jgi:transposase-like protein